MAPVTVSSSRVQSLLQATQPHQCYGAERECALHKLKPSAELGGALQRNAELHPFLWTVFPPGSLCAHPLPCTSLLSGNFFFTDSIIFHLDSLGSLDNLA